MNVLATILIGLATGALPAAAIAGFFMFKVNRATATKLLAEAEDVSKKTAIHEAQAAVNFAHDAYISVKEQCEDCRKRLILAEERLQRSEQRMHLSEERLLISEERGRRMQTALRAIVRVIDADNPAEIGEAIRAARELI